MPDYDEALTALRFLKVPRQRFDVRTRLLLEAGLDAISDMFQPPAIQSGLEFEMRWPTQDKVMACYRARSGDNAATRAVFESRWASMPDFFNDLFAWALHPAQYSSHRAMADQAGPQLLAADDLAAVTRAIALAELTDLFDRPIFRMKLLICAMSAIPPILRDALALHYQAATDWWGQTYQMLLSAADLGLREDVTLERFAMVMTAIEEGLALRYAARPDDFGNDLGEVAAALATGAMSLMNGASAPSDQRESLSEYFRRRFGGTGRPA